MEQVLEKPKPKKTKNKHKSVHWDDNNASSLGECSSKEKISKNEEKEIQLNVENIVVVDIDKDSCPKEKKKDNKHITTCKESAEENLEKVSGTRETVQQENCKSIISATEQCKAPTFDIILNENKHLLNTIINEQQIYNNVALKEKRIPCDNAVSKNDSIINIRPYTVSQLNTLYENNELKSLGQFSAQFVEAELNGLAIKQHTLYELLVNYLHFREKVTTATLELEQLKKEYRELQNNLWTIETATATEKGECQDGNVVSVSHTYNKATFHRSALQSIVRTLVNIQKLTYENYTLYSYSAEDFHLQIEIYIQTVISNCINAMQLNKNAPIALLENEVLHLKPFLTELRVSISILFSFQRKLIRDAQFITETREWLSRLIGVLLRISSFQDHLFIINHILRCPAGVGSWATSYVQSPLDLNIEEPFCNFQINHCVSVLATILMPIKQRENFLHEISQCKDTTTEALWVMVDSDGEEDEESSGTSLRENDLVALLNQLPLDNLFRAVLLVRRKDYKDVHESQLITEQHLLRYLAFSTTLLKLFYEGLQTYKQPRYNQFSKRLCRFIRHIVQYATDQWEYFKTSTHLSDPALLQRLQVEYDEFFLRAIYYLYSSQKLGAWQFLAVIPYNNVTVKNLWKIFYFLHNSDSVAHDILNSHEYEDYNKKLWSAELRSMFEEKLGMLEDAESYYLLNTFANMALARGEENMEFIYAATMDLLQVGLICEATQDGCCKSARILLTHITSKHPHLLSNILKKVVENIEKIKELALYLYEELPLSIWKVAEGDFQIISRLLLKNEITTTESKLARMILSRLNWNSISHELQCDVALLVVQAADQEPGYTQWAWQTIFRLKLHITDKAFTEIGKVSDIDRYDILVKGVREQQPLACFVSILLTTWGHLVPLICSKGLPQLVVLQIHQKHEAVLFALYLILPLFINSQESIVNCEKFQEILSNLINADRGYILMAKNLISHQSTVLQQFGNMIETQIVNFSSYGLDSPRCLVRLWMNSLVSLPNWNRDGGITYLLDVIIRAAFNHREAIEVAYNVLKEVQQCLTPQEHGGTISSIFKWVSNTNNQNTIVQTSLSNFPWLAYLLIEIEHEEKELHTGLWKELLMVLNKQKGKVNVDQALKKAATSMKVPAMTSASLCIYRWAQQAIDTPIDHPILPLLWQKYYFLYLARIPVSSTIDKGCVGDKFFDGLVNFAFFKKIKKRLQETVDYYQRKIEVKDEDNEELDKKPYYICCSKLFRAFLLWLEEPRLQECNLLLPNLPVQYESTLLAFIIQGCNSPWFEYVDSFKMKTIQQNNVKTWRVTNFREKSNVNQPLPNPGSSMESSDPVERMLRRINSYDAPKAPPDVTNTAPILPAVDFGNKEDMLKSLEQCFKILKKFAHYQVLKISEHKAIDCAYQELIPQLYRLILNKVKRNVPCKGRNHAVHCSGAAVIILETHEARMVEAVDHQIQMNRNAYEALLVKSLQAPAMSLCSASVTVQCVVRSLQTYLQCNPSCSELGVVLFYHILSQIDDETIAYLPTKSLYTSCLSKLGQSHIHQVEQEMPRLLEKILNEPHLGVYLAPHFSPTNVGSASLLFMYSTICKGVGQKYDIAFALLSKFEIDLWLKEKQPKLMERSQFIQIVIKALTSLGFEPPVDAMMLQGLYRKHLLTVFEFQFPEHYGEVLMQLLKTSNGSQDTSLLPISVWLDILNSLSRPLHLHLKMPLSDQLRQYSQHQQMLQHVELLETATLLSRHFTQERLQYGLYGLYPKCRQYVEVFVLLLGMTGHGMLISSLKAHQGALDDDICEKMWPYLRDMFAPWLVPYSMQHLQDNLASWIKQLADDRSVLLPWIPADTQFAQKIINVFFESIQFIIQTLPACGNIFSYFWQWYVNCYAHISVKDHILHPVHQTFSALPWQNFWPSLTDVESMLRVADQCLPECHSFLANIFVSIPWPNWLKSYANGLPQVRKRVYQCFLNLLVKLSADPKIRKQQGDKVKSLLVQAESFDWTILEPSSFQHVMDWYILSCDSVVIFKTDPLDLDYRILHFLKIVSGYNIQLTKPSKDQLDKRLIYVRTLVKLIWVFTCRHKALVPSKEQELYAVVVHQLNHLGSVVQSEEELIILMNEVLGVLNIDIVSSIALKAFTEWVFNKPGDSLIVRTMLRTVGETVTDLESVASLCEVNLNSYFLNGVTESVDPTWREAEELLNILPSKQIELEQVLLNKGCLLTLNGLLIQRICRCNDLEYLLNKCLDWLPLIKISESTEPKVPLIWNGILLLALQHCDVEEACTGAVLYKFSHLLLQMSQERNNFGWGRGLLSAIGISKQDSLSLNFRFLCRALAGYIMAQLPDMKGEPQVVRHVANAPAKVGQPGGNTECVKILMSLDFGHSQGKIKDCAELALKQIQEPNNSLHNASKFLSLLLKQFYIKPYLKDIG